MRGVLPLTRRGWASGNEVRAGSALGGKGSQGNSMLPRDMCPRSIFLFFYKREW